MDKIDGESPLHPWTVGRTPQVAYNRFNIWKRIICSFYVCLLDEIPIIFIFDFRISYAQLGRRLVFNDEIAVLKRMYRVHPTQF